ncbi:MAG: undecaprenyl-phosphate glucose phosphotransferase [Steroidobacteraceae bacterium]
MADGAMHDRLQFYGGFAALSATEPSVNFAVKSLLHPVIVVACLIAALGLFGERLNGPYCLLAVVGFLVASDMLDSADRRPDYSSFAPVGPLKRILGRWSLVVAFLYVLLRASDLSDWIHWRVVATWALLTPMALWAGELLAHKVLFRAGAGSHAEPRKAAILGLTPLGLRLKQRLESDSLLRIAVSGFFDERAPERLPLAGRQWLIGQPTGLAEYVRQEGIRLVYITLPMSPDPRMLELIASLHDSTVSIYFVPDVMSCDLIQARLDVIGGMPVVAVRESPFYGARSIAKRLSDIVLASLAMVLSSPVLLLVALGVRISSPGPVIFRQRRYGLDGREILICKFRSLRVVEDGDAQYTQVTRNDERLTAFGAFIRRTSLDELPQLFNVLAGTLSLVGPRPHAIAVNEQYRKLIPGYMIRHKVKPGITGLAQVNGFRGGDDLSSMSNRIRYDLEYLRNWSLMLDLAILLRTVTLVWRDGTAY